MNKTKKYILAVCLVGVLSTACEKKEILPGKREEFLKSMEENTIINKSIANEKVQISSAVSIESHVDVAGNKQHNMVNNKMSANPSVLWKKSFGRGPINASAISFGGNIYIVDSRGILFCISQKSGEVVWEKLIAKQPDESVFSGGLTSDNGVIYVTTNIGDVVAIDSKTQKNLWTKSLKLPLKGSALFVNGKLIVTTVDSQTFSLDSRTGAIVWTKTVNKEQTMMAESSVPALSRSGVVCAYSSGDIVSLDLNSGSDNWADVLCSANISESGFVISHIAASPVVHGDSVLAATSESKMVLTDAATGARIWEQNIGTINTPLIMNGWVFALTNSGELVCLSMKDGSIKWKVNAKTFSNEKKPEDVLLTGPMIINGNIVIFDATGNIMSFDPSTGLFRKKINIEKASIARVPMIINGVMYAVTNRAEIYAIG